MISAADRLRQLYRSPGPFLSVIVACGEAADHRPTDVFAAHRERLAASGVSNQSLDAVEARLALPLPDDVAGHAVYAAADGTTVADYGMEGPAQPLVRVDSLPYAAPLLEWDQWQVPHVAVSASADGFEIVSFLPEASPEIHPYAGAPETAQACRDMALEQGVELIVIGGDAVRAGELEHELVGVLPIETTIEIIDEDVLAAVEDFADAVVRQVADRVARTTVAALRNFRFLAEHDGVAQGADDALAALAAGAGRRLLVHDDPEDDRRVRFGARPQQVGPLAELSLTNEGRLVDVAIWSAIQQDIDVRVIPSTAERGPDDDIAVVLSDAAEMSPIP